MVLEVRLERALDAVGSDRLVDSDGASERSVRSSGLPAILLLIVGDVGGCGDFGCCWPV